MRRILGSALSLAALLAVACGSDSTGPDCDAIAAALVSRIEVQPATATVNLGDSVRLTPMAFSCSGALPSITAFEWQSSDPSLAVVSSEGVVHALHSGRVRISASVQNKSGDANLTTRPVPVDSVFVAPDTAAIVLGQSSLLTAHTFDAQGREITGRAVTWSSSNPSIVSVDSTGTITGNFLGGPVTVTATVEGAAASSVVTVGLLGAPRR